MCLLNTNVLMQHLEGLRRTFQRLTLFRLTNDSLRSFPVSSVKQKCSLLFGASMRKAALTRHGIPKFVWNIQSRLKDAET